MNIITLSDHLAGTGSGTGRHSAANVEDAEKVAVVLTPVSGTITFTVEGSHDGSHWTTLEYVTEDSSVAAVKTAIAASAPTVVYLDGLDKRFFSQIAINVSAATGEYDAELRVV